MRLRPLLAVAAVVLPAAPALRAQSTLPPAATVNVLGVPIANGVNVSGQATGWVSTTPSGSQEAALTGPDGQGARRLGFLPGTAGSGRSEGYAVNAAGRVAGIGRTARVAPSEAFLTGPDGQGLRGLGFLPGYASSWGRGVNAAGQVTGYGFNTTAEGGVGESEAFLTGADGEGMRGLGFLPGGTRSQANAVNDAGQVAGWSSSATGGQAFLTGANGDGMRGLGFLAGGSFSFGTALNATGQVTGFANSARSGSRSEPFVTGPGGVGMVGLGFGSLLGADAGVAEGIDDGGRVVGRVTNARRTPVGSFRNFAFVYTPDAGLQLLDDVVGGGWQITDASGISANGGYIVAYGSNAGMGIGSSALLIRLGAASSVVPEPGTWMLLGAGLLAVGGVSWRRRRSTG